MNIKARTLQELHIFFQSCGHYPSTAIWEAVEDVVDCLCRMADGSCSPVYYLSSLDPGVGKTQAVVQFLKVLVSCPEYRGVGVLIGVGRLDEVKAYVEAAALSNEQFAVLTSDVDLNALGSGKPQSSQVLFTTQQRIERHTAGRFLQQVKDFSYRGKPRAVRVWDETLEPARAIAFPVDDLLLLIRKYGPVAPHGFVEDLEELRQRLKEVDGEAVVDIPDLGSKHEVNRTSALSWSANWTEEEQAVSANLWLLMGCTVSVRRDGRYGASVVHYREHLPEDLPPLLILDASGRVRETYVLWERHRGDLVRLKEARKNYVNLRVYVWAKGGGKEAFQKDRQELLRGIARTIDSKPKEDWLIVHHKEAETPADGRRRGKAGQPSTQAEVRDLVTKADPAKLHFVSWGRHQATNAYADVHNVILAGTLFYRPSMYEALWRAAADFPGIKGLLRDEWRRKIERGEHRHMILQALCRGAVRRSLGDTCEPCEAYVIASARSGIPEEIERIFPKCTVGPWKPIPRQLTGRVKQAADFILVWFSENPSGQLPIRAVREAIGMKSAGNFTTHVRKHEDFREFLRENHIYERGSGRFQYLTKVIFHDASAELEEEEETAD